jgi:hypothetical protein
MLLVPVVIRELLYLLLLVVGYRGVEEFQFSQRFDSI